MTDELSDDHPKKTKKKNQTKNQKTPSTLARYKYSYAILRKPKKAEKKRQGGDESYGDESSDRPPTSIVCTTVITRQITVYDVL